MNIGLTLGAMTPAIRMASDPASATLASELSNAQAEHAKLQRPGAPTIINTIRGNRMGQETPIFEAAAQRQWDNSQGRVLAAQAAFNQYNDQRKNVGLQQGVAQAAAARDNSEADKNKLAAEVFRDPRMARHDLLRSGVEPSVANSVYPDSGAPVQPGQTYSAQNLPAVMRQSSNEYLRPFFDKSSPEYKENEGLTAPEVFDRVMKMSPPEARDPKSELARVVMSSMNQRYPDGFGDFPTVSPEQVAENAKGSITTAYTPLRFPWFNQNILGPSWSIMSNGSKPTWNWRRSYEQGKSFQDFINQFNQANASGVGVTPRTLSVGVNQ